MGLLYSEICVILASAVFDWSTRVTDGRTDGRTDGIAMAYTRYSIYALARKNQEDKTNLDLLEQEIVSGSGLPVIFKKSFSFDATVMIVML